MRFSRWFGRSLRHPSSFMAALALAGMLASCGGGGGNDSGVPAGGDSGGGTGGGSGGTTTTTLVAGRVQDGSAQPVANATVLLDSQTATTGSDGSFSFTVANTADNKVVLVKKAGYATTAKEAPVTPGRSTNVTVGLFADQVSTSFDATVGVSFSPNGAGVAIPANAVQTAAGAPYNGTVQVGSSYYGPDTVAGVQAFAAPYEGLSAGARSPLITAGVIEVKLSDPSGNPLQLRAGSTATLTYPATSVSAGAATIPLWYYDEAAKVWTEEGQATRQSDGRFTGSVTHFTMWNLDIKGESATLKGCFVDASGAPQTQAGVFGLRGYGWAHVLPGTADGNFTLLRVPANIPLELFSLHDPANFTTVAIPALSPGEVRQLPCSTATAVTSGNIIDLLPLPTVLFTPPVGTFAGNYVGTYSGQENGTFNVTIAASGTITGSTVSTTFANQVLPVTGNVSANGSVLLSAGTSGAATFTGTVTPSGLVSGIWQYAGRSADGNTFVGQRQ